LGIIKCEKGSQNFEEKPGNKGNLFDVVAGEGNVVEAEHSLRHGVVGGVDIHPQACSKHKGQVI
jgi:hypothetical protein